MARILMALSEAPYPDRSNGQTIRWNPIVRNLAGRHVVDLVIANDQRHDARECAAATRQFCNSVTEADMPDRNLLVRRMLTLGAVASRKRAPYRMIKHWSRDLAACIARQAQRHDYDCMLWCGNFSDALSLFLSSSRKRNQRTIIDWIDSPSLHMSHVAINRGSNAQALLDRANAALLARWERYVNARCDAAVYITERDALHANGASTSNVHVIPNGLLDDGPPEAEARRRSQGALTIGFLGNMGYQPNIDAALRLHSDIYLPLKEEYRTLKLKIIGRAPTEAIQRLRSPDVQVTGPVASIWPHISSTDIFVFPMRIGGGMQNKLLEAMRASRPVIASTICVAGLDSEARDVVAIADSDDEFRSAVRHLINDPGASEALGRSGREYVRRYDWSEIVPRYERLLLSSPTQKKAVLCDDNQTLVGP